MTDSMRWFSLVMIALFLAFVYLLGPVLMPFVFSFLLAYFLNPMVMRLTKWKLPRTLAAVLVFIVAVTIIFGVLFSLVPALEKQLVTFSDKLPVMLNWVKESVVPWINQRFHLQLQIDPNVIQSFVLAHVNQHGGSVAKLIIKTLFNSGFVLVEIVMNSIMIPVITLYLLVDWVKVTSHGKGLLPFQAATREMIGNLAKDCGDVLAAFFRGQVLVMIGSGVVYTVGLYILGLDLALLVGVLAGLLTVVPYLGFISGIVLALSAAAIQFHSLMPLIWVLVIFAVGVLCENFVFSPLFVGDRIGLHPVAVIFAVLAGGKLFGFVGVLLALPVAAVIMVLFRYWHKRYFESETLQKGEAA